MAKIKSRRERQTAARGYRQRFVEAICKNELPSNELMQGVEYGLLSGWEDKCPYLQRSDPELLKCELLASSDFKRLCDSEHGRCTLPVLVRACDRYLRKKAGPFFKSESWEKAGQIGKRTTVRAPKHESPELIPDYASILNRLRKITSDRWRKNVARAQKKCSEEDKNNETSKERDISGASPSDWARYLHKVAYRAVRDLLVKATKCKWCTYFLPRASIWCLNKKFEEEVQSGWKRDPKEQCRGYVESIGEIRPSKISRPDLIVELGESRDPVQRTIDRIEELVFERMAATPLHHPRRASYDRQVAIVGAVRGGTEPRRGKRELATQLGISIEELRDDIISLKRYLIRCQRRDEELADSLARLVADDDLMNSLELENPFLSIRS